jgi:hypothetical protein
MITTVMITTVMITTVMIITVVITVTVIIPVTVAVPTMVMCPAAALPFPVALEEALTVMMRRDPDRADVRWTGPIARVPLVMVSHWIPVTRHPSPFWAGRGRLHHDHPRGRRRANSHANGDVGGESCTADQHNQS